MDLARRKGLYSQGGLAAKPGTSDHGWGRSTDLDLDSKALTWMRANGAKYGFAEDVPRGFFPQARAFCERMPKAVDEYEAILSRNAIWLERTQGVGLLSTDDAIALGQSGPMLRASGVDWDLRRREPYLALREGSGRDRVRQIDDLPATDVLHGTPRDHRAGLNAGLSDDDIGVHAEPEVVGPVDLPHSAATEDGLGVPVGELCHD